MSMSSGLPPSAVAAARALCLSTIAPVHGAAVQPIGQCDDFSSNPSRRAIRPSPPSMYGKPPNESMSSWSALNATSVRSAPALRTPRPSAVAIGGTSFDPFVPCTQCAGTGPPWVVNDTWSNGW